MNIDDRLQALTMNLELASREIQDLRGSIQELMSAQQVAYSNTIHNFEIALDSIKSLEAIALRHEERIDEHAERLDTHDERLDEHDQRLDERDNR